MTVDFNHIPKDWKKVKISEKLFFQEGPGVRKWQFTQEGIKLLNVGNINNGKVDLEATDKHLSIEEATGKYAHFLVDEGDLLIACSGIVVDNFHNKIAFAKKEHLPLCLNTSTMRFKPLEDDVDLYYFKYFLQTVHFTSQLQKLITGSAQLNFGPSHIKKIDFLLPPIKTQQRIASILDDAAALRDKTAQLLTEYDLLAQSIFLEMFGDPSINPKRWDIKPFDYFAKFDTNMTSDFEKYGDLPHIGISSIERDSGHLVNYKLVKEESLSSGKYLFDERHIIYSKIRPNLNKVALPNFRGLSSADSYPILVRPEHSNRYFFSFLLRSKSFIDFILNYSVRTSIPKANKSQILKYSGIAPPIETQNQFADKITLIEQQKTLAKQELQESEDLFNCLLQQAFKGELV